MEKQTSTEAKVRSGKRPLLVKMGHASIGVKLVSLCFALLLFSAIGFIAHPFVVHASMQGTLKRRPGPPPPTFIPPFPFPTPTLFTRPPKPTDTPIPPTPIPPIPTDTPVPPTATPTDTPTLPTPTNTPVPTATPTKVTGVVPVGKTPNANGNDFATLPPDITPTLGTGAVATSNNDDTPTSQQDTNGGHSQDSTDTTMTSALIAFSAGILLMLTAGGIAGWHLYSRKRRSTLLWKR